MKIIAIGLFALLCTACASTSTNWREGEVSGSAGVPYEIDVDDLEVKFSLYKHHTHRFDGSHTLEIEHDEIKYEMFYRF